ncbi:hypothetical protein NDU88_007115 [Pleurodeles waltl]|uniref:Uncharacterized protein n=1 Tax=Pleurodeles waltl TaxID=8319 RepID=A0AAV7N184_PLEWA|nr:hypothetical protein NDU88_007115 [Pleurodeles waltl]
MCKLASSRFINPIPSKDIILQRRFRIPCRAGALSLRRWELQQDGRDESCRGKILTLNGSYTSLRDALSAWLLQSREYPQFKSACGGKVVQGTWRLSKGASRGGLRSVNDAVK